MLPTWQLGPFTLASYGTLIILGCLVGAAALVWQARRQKYPVQDALFAFLYGLLGVIIGGKVFYLVQSIPELVAQWGEIGADPTRLLSYLSGGFVFYGSLLGGILGVLIYARQFRMFFGPLIITLIPVVPLIHAFGRLGCFCAGCCYGIAYDGPFSVVFSQSPPGLAPHGVPLFPVQLLESALLLALAAFLFVYSNRAKQPRNLLGCYLLGYGLIRFATEFLRGDAVRGFWWILSTSQWISLLAIGVAIILLWRPPGPFWTGIGRQLPVKRNPSLRSA
ncbi:MAG: prolipoprotein diacylglyceryl transferase [Actinomycetia bacterium]|nr:prolipoprotein diacylglyceryl transferase [Actinomycetes bacterium]